MTADRQNTDDTFNVRVVPTDHGPCLPAVDVAAALNGIALAAEDAQAILDGFGAFVASVEEVAVRWPSADPQEQEGDDRG